jgi:hypothetical protein
MGHNGPPILANAVTITSMCQVVGTIDGRLRQAGDRVITSANQTSGRAAVASEMGQVRTHEVQLMAISNLVSCVTS